MWEFAIDVGGTFTDVLGRDEAGRTRRIKVLSSGVTRRSGVFESATSTCLVQGTRGEPDGFWAGATVRLPDETGGGVAEATVLDSTPERLAVTPWTDSTGPPPADGTVGHFEILTDDPAPVVGIRRLMGVPVGQPLPPCVVRLGTTRGTNALLTRRGAATAAILTEGLDDLLTIGFQARPDLFDLTAAKPAPLFRRAVTVRERLAADGSVLVPLEEVPTRQTLETLRAEGITALAVALLHSWRNGEHERRVATWAREAGFATVSLSHVVAAEIGLIARGETAVVDAYLSPVLVAYLADLTARLPGSVVRLMTSGGGLVSGDAFTGKDSILSGPAGGAVALGRLAESLRETLTPTPSPPRGGGAHRADEGRDDPTATGDLRPPTIVSPPTPDPSPLGGGGDRTPGSASARPLAVIGFDMGGTSTDVCRYAGKLERQFESVKAGVHLTVPMLAVETIAAGGGSICRFDGVRLIVGPDSAGADPGPACYGRGGPLTVTDVNVYLGRVPPDALPVSVDRNVVDRRLRDVMALMPDPPRTAAALAEGFVALANTAMAQAVRAVSLARGYDPADHVLVPFGGAAAQHACAVAEMLGQRRILVPADAGIFSAVGIGVADCVRHASAGVLRPLAEITGDEWRALEAELTGRATAAVAAEGVPVARIAAVATAEVRRAGTVSPLELPLHPVRTLAERFVEEHVRRYGWPGPDRPLDVTAVRVEAIGAGDRTLPSPESGPSAASRPGPPWTDLWLDDGWQKVPCGRVADVPVDVPRSGPAVLVDPTFTAVVDPGWTVEKLPEGHLLLTREADASAPPASEASPGRRTPEVVAREVVARRLTGIADQMGAMLRRTALSVNVKERLDYSCAVFTAAGRLVVNAPHIPVHLGAMSHAVVAAVEALGTLRPGDVVVTNDPYSGGSHLPDVTVIEPVYAPGGGPLLFHVASRAHHAEIGGITPGSMPPDARTLAEEGVLIRPWKLFEGGSADWDGLRRRLSSGPYPSRAVEDNVADLAAQVAAGREGARLLGELIAEVGADALRPLVESGLAATAAQAAAWIETLGDGPWAFADALDDGTPVAVTVRRAGGRLTIDFTGTGGVHPGNLNATPAIATAAVLYVVRCLIGSDVPLSDGLLGPLEIVVPPGLLRGPRADDPSACPAVCGGNVETSQRLVDVLLGALADVAASQGTMNNFLFGNSDFGYYETIAGGAGATPAGPGTDAVHTHMTNTRLTDPEVLETRFPVRLERFTLRPDSGGAGRHAGGRGLIRRVRFLDAVTVSLLTGRRTTTPRGRAGGGPGRPGVNLKLDADGTATELPPICRIDLVPGEAIELRTPGGGGYGPPP